MGHQIASKVNMTMLGRASGRHYLAFTGKERLVRSSPQPTALASGMLLASLFFPSRRQVTQTQSAAATT
jgi:hypothetical protein